jgi:protein-disulfide isomerase
MSTEPETKSQKREAAKAKAIAMRKAEQKKRKQRLITTWVTSGVALLGVAALVFFVVTGNNTLSVQASTTAPNNMASDGAILTSPTEVKQNTGYDLEKGKPSESTAELADSDVPHVEIYLDYACPHCAEFEEANSDYMTSLLESNRATVEVKPIVVLNTPMSYTGSNAAACVANYAPEKLWQFNSELFALTTDSGTNESGVRTVLSNLDLTADEKKTVGACDDSNMFSKWVETATLNALARTDASNAQLVTGTPTVLVDGVKYPFGPKDFKTFMEAVLNGATPEQIIADNS